MGGVGERTDSVSFSDRLIVAAAAVPWENSRVRRFPTHNGVQN